MLPSAYQRRPAPPPSPPPSRWLFILGLLVMVSGAFQLGYLVGKHHAPPTPIARFHDAHSSEVNDITRIRAAPPSSARQKRRPTMQYQVTGAGSSAVNGTYTRAGINIDGWTYYANENGVKLWWFGASGIWVFSDTLDTFPGYYSGDTMYGPKEPENTTWTNLLNGVDPKPTVTPSGLSSVTKAATSISEVETGGASWSNLSNMLDDDSDYASIAPQGTMTPTDYAKLTGFNFAIPAGSIIIGYKIDVMWRQGMSMGQDNSAYLLKGDTWGNYNRVPYPHNIPPTGTFGQVSYGAVNDLFGGEFTALSDINASDFGLAYNVINECYSYDLDVQYISMTVYYEAGTPPNEPPSCTLTLDSIASRLVTVTIEGLDSDGDLSSGVIDWDDTTTTELTGGELATLQGGDSVTKSHTYDSAGGDFTITATLTDDADATGTDSVLAEVDANTQPSCSLATQSIASRLLTVTLQGQDSDGSLASGSIAWGDGQTTTLDAGERTTLQGGGTLTKTHTYTSAGGSFNVVATLTDNEGSSKTSSLTAVISANTSPVAAFTVEIDPTDHRTVTVNASSSSDPDGTITAWRFLPGNGAGWRTGTVGEALVYTYPTHGTYTGTVEVTDNEGATDTETASIAVVNAPPTASFTIDADWKNIVLTDTSEDGDGTIQTVMVDWGDGSESESITPGGSPTHEYADSGEYEISLTATDDNGETDTATDILTIDSFTGEITAEITAGTLVEVSAAGITPPAGQTIVSYSWDWGDMTANGSGVTARHNYTTASPWTITLTLTLASGETFDIEKEILMATITKVTTAAGPLAEPGVTVITITGTGLPLTGAVKIGGVAGAVQGSPARSETSIAVIADASAPLGPADVEVWNAESTPALVASSPMAVVLYDSTDLRDGLEVPFLAVDYVWIDGLNVGFAGDGFSVTPSYTEKSYTPPNAFVAANVKSWLSQMEVDLKIDQVNGPNLATVLGGTWDAETETLTVDAQNEMAQHSIVAKDIYGNLTLIRAAVIVGGGKLTFSKDFANIETTWRVIRRTGVPMLEKYGFDSGSD